MQKAIWAVWGHSCSTDDEPMHWFCPTNPNTWYLSHPALLKKCLGGKTQNPNESLNSLIWKFCPKTIGSSLQIAEIAANLETSVFNDGNQILITILEKFCLKINRNVCVSLAERDNRRIFTSRQRRLESSLKLAEPRKLKRVKKLSCFRNRKDGRQVHVAGQDDHSECAVRKCWEHWTREGTHVRRTGSGAARKTTRREDRRIVQQAVVDPTVTRSAIRADVGVKIDPQTISRHLAEANLKSKHPFRAFSLTPEHRQLRLQWCQARSMWNVRYWQNVVFSDESRFVLGTDDNRVRVWRCHVVVIAYLRKRSVRALQMNEKRWCKAKVDCEVNKNSVFSNVRLEKIEHCGKKGYLCYWKLYIVDFNKLTIFFEVQSANIVKNKL
ncbi:transposable element Tc1 transposase [Trichonephila clavipes]|nr:transposable element Tc1 transposase [Trichonephila clavipes]